MGKAAKEPKPTQASRTAKSKQALSAAASSDKEAAGAIANVERANAEAVKQEEIDPDLVAPDPPEMPKDSEAIGIVTLNEATGLPWPYDMKTKMITPTFVEPMVKPSEMDREEKMSGMFQRSIKTDTKCMDMLSYIPSAQDLAASIGIMDEKVVTTLKCAAFSGGPDMMNGKIGDGMLVVTQIGEELRLHFVVNQSSATMQSKETFTEKIQSHASTSTSGERENAREYDLQVLRAYQSEHRVDGGYMVDGNFIDFLYAHAEWQDTARVSSMLKAQEYEWEKTKQAAPPKPVETGGGCCPCCCGPPKETAPAPKPQVALALDTYSDKSGVKSGNAVNKVMLEPELERYLKVYSEAIEEVKDAYHPTKKDGELKGKEETKTLLKKLHTIHLAYRVHDLLIEDKIRTLVIVADPYESTFEDVMKFTSMCHGFILKQVEKDEKLKEEAQKKAEEYAMAILAAGSEAPADPKAPAGKTAGKKAVPPPPPTAAGSALPAITAKELGKGLFSHHSDWQPPLKVKGGSSASSASMNDSFDAYAGVTRDKGGCCSSMCGCCYPCCPCCACCKPPETHTVADAQFSVSV